MYVDPTNWDACFSCWTQSDWYPCGLTNVSALQTQVSLEMNVFCSIVNRCWTNRNQHHESTDTCLSAVTNRDGRLCGHGLNDWFYGRLVCTLHGHSLRLSRMDCQTNWTIIHEPRPTRCPKTRSCKETWQSKTRVELLPCRTYVPWICFVPSLQSKKKKK
jgi:hypothetical protein